MLFRSAVRFDEVYLAQSLSKTRSCAGASIELIEIVGWFRIRHWLTEELAKGAGHIGYGIRKDFRGKGYASLGLKLTIEKAWQMIREDEIYMSIHKDNPASLKVQMKNGAYIHHEDEQEIYTRIKR